MKKEKSFSLMARAQSFGFAFDGVLAFFRSEHNAILHSIATVAVIVLAILVPVSSNELILLIIAIAMVWMAELFNTAIEKIMNLLVPTRQPAVKLIKDLSAAAVLITAVAALVIGCIIFIPKI